MAELIASRNSVYVGGVQQTETSGIADLKMSIAVYKTNETADKFSFYIEGAFQYNGWYNYVPLKVGYLTYRITDGVVYRSDSTIRDVDITAESYPVYATSLGSAAAPITIDKRTSAAAFVPFCQVGTLKVDRVKANEISPWFHGGSAGIMLAYSEPSGKRFINDWTRTYSNGITYRLDAYTLFASEYPENYTIDPFNQNSAVMVIPPINATNKISVYSSGSWKNATATYVYSGGKWNYTNNINVMANNAWKTAY